ncbi:MAG: chemotaxis protein CheA [Bacillota bacterium]|nr:chemotaxis protein CheA [Bacillota bacterium]
MDTGLDSMLDIYLFETKELLETLDDILINSEKANMLDEEGINEIFRIMHTVKGSSAMMQYHSLATVTHIAEDLLSYVRQNGVLQEYYGELFELMFEVSDFIKAEVAHVENNEPLTNDIGKYEQKISNFLKKISQKVALEDKPVKIQQEKEKAKKESPVSASPVSASPVSASPVSQDEAAPDFKDGTSYALRVYFDEDAGMENLRALMLINEMQDASASAIAYEPEKLEGGPEIANVIRSKGFCVYLSGENELKAAEGVAERFPYTKNYTVFHKEQASTGTESEQDDREGRHPDAGRAQALVRNQPAKQNLISVNLTKLNSLMDLMGEIVITESMVMAMTGLQAENTDSQFGKAARQLRKLTDELQEIVTSIRMVPINSVFQKMNRIVRDMGKSLGKDVQLILVGEDTEVDKTIVDSIADPIMHVVRNSMDHGIEMPEVRLKNGKTDGGTITLTAKNTGGDIVITITDDGGGVNRDGVLAKAKKQGLLKKPESEYSDQEVYDLLLLPGFSTKEKVTEFSGRGVGLDVVKKNIEKIGGDVTIFSRINEGTKISFKIPLTLAIVNGMKIAVGKTMFILPIHSIKQTFKAKKQSILFNEDMKEIIRVRDSFYPVIRLHREYGIETEITDIEEGIMIQVETHELSYCIFADELLCEQQVVVKPLPVYIQKQRIRKSGIEGCAILGDGGISLILDVHRLFTKS